MGIFLKESVCLSVCSPFTSKPFDQSWQCYAQDRLNNYGAMWTKQVYGVRCLTVFVAHAANFHER